MIDKYAEIQYRITLYNACKGILRVKQASMWGTALNAFNSFGGKAMNAVNAAGKAMQPVTNALTTAGKTVGTYANKGYNTVANPIKSGLRWLGSEGVQNNMQNIQNAAGTISSVAGAGTATMGVMNQMKQQGNMDAAADLAGRRTQLENARLDMVEKQLNAQRNAMGLGNVGEEAVEDGAEGDAAQQSQFGAQSTAQ